MIEFKDVIFVYNSKNVIDNLNLCIWVGEKIGIVGCFGVGKLILI